MPKRDTSSGRGEGGLTADATIFDCGGTIARSLLSAAKACVNGILEGADPEHLHKYRVSFRRLRSMLSLFKGVYAKEDSREAKDLLAGIMARTNRLRDLDVYLMNRERYSTLVPESHRPGLGQMFGQFAEERQNVFRQVCTFLQSTEYHRQMDALQHLFAEPQAMGAGSKADESACHFAGREMLKRYEKVAAIAQSIQEASPDARIHELRIECKKLRYLIEFFAPLFSQKNIMGQIRLLKEVQDVLGRFNDYRVQHESLAAFVEEPSVQKAEPIEMIESVRVLAEVLNELKLKTRSEIGACLKGFIDENTQKQFRRLATR